MSFANTHRQYQQGYTARLQWKPASTTTRSFTPDKKSKQLSETIIANLNAIANKPRESLTDYDFVKTLTVQRGKRGDGIVLLYNDGNTYVRGSGLQNYIKSFIFNLDPEGAKEAIATQYNKMIIDNDDIIDFLTTTPISGLFMQTLYEGTHIIVYNHRGAWKFSTRRCLNADVSFWRDKEDSHGTIARRLLSDEYLNEMSAKFGDPEHNKFVYHYNLVSSRHRYILDYSDTLGGKEYNVLRPVMVTERGSFQVNLGLTEQFTKDPSYMMGGNSDTQPVDRREIEIKSDFNFEDFIRSQINDLNCDYMNRGYIIEAYDMDGNLTIMNLQSDVYRYIYDIYSESANAVEARFLVNWKVFTEQLPRLNGLPDINDTNQLLVEAKLKLLSIVLYLLYKDTHIVNVKTARPIDRGILFKLIQDYKPFADAISSLHHEFITQKRYDRTFIITADFIEAIYLKRLPDESICYLSNYVNEILVNTNFMNNEILATFEADMMKQLAVERGITIVTTQF